jgi:transposase InsO family protein
MTMSVTDLVGRLKEAEEAFEEVPTSLKHEGKLYLTEEEWDARRRRRELENHSGGGAARGGASSSRRGGRRGRGRGRASGGPGGSNKSAWDECRRCGKTGHWARECRLKPKREMAHVTQEEEATLLLVKSSPEKITVPEKFSIAQSERAWISSAQIMMKEERVLAHLDDRKERDVETWVLDTGATNHMSGARSAFIKLEEMELGSVRFGDDSMARIEDRGTVAFLCKTGEIRSLGGVYFIPRLTTNIVSIGQLDEARYKVDVSAGVMKIQEPGDRLLAKVRRETNRLYLLQVKLAPATCLAVRGRNDEDARLWHERFGHVNMAALRKLAWEEMVRGLPSIGQVDRVCEACQAGKQRRTSFPIEAEYRAHQRLELVHACGPITPATPRGNKYFLLMVDDFTRYMWVAAIPSKDCAATAIKEIQAQAEGRSGAKLRALRTDRGGEFTATEFTKYCAAEGIHRQHTAPYSPQQNGVVERRNGSVVATARSMLKAKGLPGWFWGEAVSTAVYVLNRCPTKSVDDMTPFEAWHGKKPAVKHLKTFGCLVYVRNTTPHLKKLEDRGRKMVFIGYEHDSKAYRAYNPVTKRVHVTRDVVFDERA